jgi:preprotein translocase SecE subunit
MKITEYLKETKAELKEVVFPTSSQTVIFTVLVIVISLSIAVILGLSDFGLKELLQKIVTR